MEKIVYVATFYLSGLIVFLNRLGGKKGFGHAIWRVAKHRYNGKKPYIVFTYTSPDGDQGPFFILFSLN